MVQIFGCKQTFRGASKVYLGTFSQPFGRNFKLNRELRREKKTNEYDVS